MVSNRAIYHKCLILNVNNKSNGYVNMSKMIVKFRSNKKEEVIFN